MEALGSLYFITYMRTFPEITQIFCSGLNGAQLALLHAPTLGSVGMAAKMAAGVAAAVAVTAVAAGDRRQ